MRAAIASGLLIFFFAVGCRSPIAPPPPPPPPPPVNTPPAVALASSPPLRVEAGETLELRADVKDDETPLDQLEYAWSAAGVDGAFTPIDGNPRHVKWEAPRGRSPAVVAFTLSVTEQYQENGVSKTHQVSATSTQSHYNDSPADLLRIAMRFITELFPDYTVTPEQAVQDFSDSCPGKRRELLDVAGNRARTDRRILSGTYSNVAVSLNALRTQANVSGACVFRDLVLTGSSAGRIVTTEGTCNLTAVYEQWKWFLCDSTFDPPAGETRESLKFRAPGWRE